MPPFLESTVLSIPTYESLNIPVLRLSFIPSFNNTLLDANVYTLLYVYPCESNRISCDILSFSHFEVTEKLPFYQIFTYIICKQT
nr:MAG TPA: hypothetical protein [Caudoviricetes sp.]